MNIILCGLPGCGKSTIGKWLAQLLKRQFFDTDVLIEKEYALKNHTALSCREIYQKHGEFFFRELETKAVQSLLGVHNSIIATGGGTLLSSNNITILKSIGKLIYLNTPFNVLYNRLLYNGIPAYLDPLNLENSFQNLAEQRSNILLENCDLTIDIYG